eukprot:351652-Chlamydomonas_euryale.AAC.12
MVAGRQSTGQQIVPLLHQCLQPLNQCIHLVLIDAETEARDLCCRLYYYAPMTVSYEGQLLGIPSQTYWTALVGLVGMPASVPYHIGYVPILVAALFCAAALSGVAVGLWIKVVGFILLNVAQPDQPTCTSHMHSCLPGLLFIGQPKAVQSLTQAPTCSISATGCILSATLPALQLSLASGYAVLCVLLTVLVGPLWASGSTVMNYLAMAVAIFLGRHLHPGRCTCRQHVQAS